MRYLAVLCALLLSSPAWADMYKCSDAKGGTVLRDVPCGKERAAQSAPPPWGRDAPREEIRQRIVALLRAHPSGLSPAQVRRMLGMPKDLTQTMQAMAREGLIQRVAVGWYIVGQ